MSLSYFPLLEFPPAVAPLLESLLLTAALSLLVFPLSGWIGWMLVTRRISTLMRWIAWGAVFSALLTPARLVAEGVPLHWIELFQGRIALLFVLLFSTVALSTLFAVKLFAVTAAVGREQRYQLGLVDRVAPAMVVRPLLLRLMVWVFGASLLVVNFDFGVAERLGVETLPVVLYLLEQPEPLLLLQWVLLLSLSLTLLLGSYRRLPRVLPEQISAGRVSMKTRGTLLVMMISLLYTPLGVALGPFIYG